MEKEILRKKEVVQKVGLSLSSIWRRERDGSFPKRIKLGNGRAVGWLRVDIDDWLRGLKG